MVVVVVVVMVAACEMKLPPRVAPTWKDPVVDEVDPDDEKSVRSKGDVDDATGEERMSDEEEELPTTRKDEDALITGNDDDDAGDGVFAPAVEGELVLPLIIEKLVTSCSCPSFRWLSFC